MDYKTQIYVLEQLYEKYLIPFTIIGKDLNLIIPNRKKKSQYLREHDYFVYYKPDKIVVFEKNDSYFSVFPCHFQNQKCKILIGPCEILDLADSLLDESNLSMSILYSVKKQEKFIEYLKLIYAILWGVLPEESQFEREVKQGTSKLNQNLKENIDLRRYEDGSLDSIELEKRYISAICRNDINTVEWIFKKIISVYFVKLSSNRLESLKYKTAALVAILTRVSINNGVSPLIAYSLSDTLIQKLDYIHSIQEGVMHIKECSLLFMNLIHYNGYTGGNSLIKDIMDYVEIHLYEKISLDDLSRYMQKHANHLSAEFKKHTGETIHNYIIRKKIYEARYLLMFTDKSSQDIATSLNFSTQSHFINKFKQIEHCTPREFKKKYGSMRLF